MGTFSKIVTNLSLIKRTIFKHTERLTKNLKEWEIQTAKLANAKKHTNCFLKNFFSALDLWPAA